MKTAKIELSNIKSSDGWGELAFELGKTEDEISDIFEYGEYGSIEIIVDENLNIVGGKIIPFKP